MICFLNSLENYENHENLKFSLDNNNNNYENHGIACDNYENHEIIRISCENHKIIKILKKRFGNHENYSKYLNSIL